ncbi:MAG: hypothetical protein EOO07_15695 [Chitinophagaceae bacterium]|nr:MAG: hypothetical protein EOO07_15695 [Chitinophagaceae bacterium]
MKKYVFLAIILILSSFQFLSAQQNFSDTLSYEIVHNNIVLKVKVNGKDARFIYDTGGIPWIISSEAERLGITKNGYKSASDMNQKSAWQEKGIVESLEISPNCITQQMETVISGDMAMFKNAGLAGLINNDAFANVVVSILPREQKIVLTPYRPKGVNKADGIQATLLTNKAFVIPIKIGEKTTEVMFDTGFDRFIGLKNEIAKETNNNGIEIANNFYGITAIGVHGLPEPDHYFKLALPSLTVGKNIFTKGTSITHSGTRNIIGAELFKYGNVILDIPRQMFYFYPFDNQKMDLGGVIKTWNILVLPMTDYFGVGGVWGKIDNVKFGDTVTHINGKSLKDFPQDQFKIEKLMDEIKEDTSTLTLLKNGKPQVVTIRRVY